MPKGLRTALVRLHRWMGLGIAIFLVITGLTGSILAFRAPLDHLLNADLLTVSLKPGQKELPIERMIDHAREALPQAEPLFIPLARHPGESLVLLMRPRVGVMAALDYDQAFFDPYDGTLLGTRDSRRSLFDRRSTIGFIYKLHRQLALPPVWGGTILGLVAILWTIDSFAGFALTLPASGGTARKSFWARWKISWTIKPRAPPARRILDLHRAGGLWLWGMLLLFAWSSVMLSAGPVYQAIMERFVVYDEPRRNLPVLPPDQRDMRLDWRDALAAGRRHLPETAHRYGLTIEYESALARDLNRNLYIYYVRSDRDIRDDDGSTGLFIDGRTGELLTLSLPRKDGAAGNAFNQWMYGLHMAQVFGLPYRILVALLGILVSGLSITGIIIWWKKRSARASLRRRDRLSQLPMRQIDVAE
ncbi:PepSY-associated TM helix domain-containing protein [Sphingobium cloacae]|uniref:Putative iron-regulated membrane protein n=1 Tax=Sphingobium cloacae TaxID=120107 RepID=A0A1E1F4A1_9SPHN|nr:PepSY-associated TM helix domain-containing protein [Sphingobium cloacae]BAV65345.1 putative iron-regulated membrane protein [Sphingobium cloacae]